MYGGIPEDDIQIQQPTRTTYKYTESLGLPGM